MDRLLRPHARAQRALRALPADRGSAQPAASWARRRSCAGTRPSSARCRPSSSSRRGRDGLHGRDRALGPPDRVPPGARLGRGGAAGDPHRGQRLALPAHARQRAAARGGGALRGPASTRDGWSWSCRSAGLCAPTPRSCASCRRCAAGASGCPSTTSARATRRSPT
jgi:hypothetical protein